MSYLPGVSNYNPEVEKALAVLQDAHFRLTEAVNTPGENELRPLFCDTFASTLKVLQDERPPISGHGSRLLGAHDYRTYLGAVVHEFDGNRGTSWRLLLD